MTEEEVMAVVRYNDFPVTFSGGDPMYSADAILPLARSLVAEGYGIWCYTGFTYEEIEQYGTEAQRELLGLVDVLVDGPYVASLRSTDLRFRGSSNQRLIDVKATLRSGIIRSWE
jgi:anaerobic ribonucleoside-triphosphate reductase activating protein